MKKEIAMLKGIIFDMDGTITMTEHLHNKAYNTVLQKFGLSLTLEEEILKYSGSGARNIFTKVFESHGIQITPEQLEECIRKNKEVYKKIVQESEIPLVAGVREFVAKIIAKGLKRIIATGNSDLNSVRLMLTKVGLSEFFKDMISIVEVAHGKPFPDVFLEAARRMDCAPSACLVLEDAINGVLAAKASSIRCIALETTTPSSELFKAGASAVVKDYTELTDDILYGNAK